MKCVAIQMKATEQYFPIVLFNMLYRVVNNFWFCGWNDKMWPLLCGTAELLCCSVPFEPMDEILWCDHSNESYRALPSCGAVYYAAQGVNNFWVCGWNLNAGFNWWWSRKSASDQVKIKNQSHKQSYKLVRIEVGRIKMVPYSSDSAYDSDAYIVWSSEN